MNREGQQYPVTFPRPNNNGSDRSPTAQSSENDMPVNKEQFSRFVQAAVIETLTKLHGGTPIEEKSSTEEKSPGEGFFRPIFDGEDSSNYEKLDSNFVRSLVDHAPEKLKFIIKLYANPRSYGLVSQNSCFKNKFLLYGPPGVGKSSLAKAFADYCDIPRQFIVAASLLNQYQHSGQQNLRQLFDPLLAKRSKDPNVIIFDEFTSVINTDEKTGKNNEEKMLSVLLNILDSLETHKNIIFIATTNDIKVLPPQIKDRFSGSIFKIPNFDFKRREQFYHYIKNKRAKNNFEKERTELTEEFNEEIEFDVVLDDKEIKDLSKKSSNFEGRDLNEVQDAASMLALRKYVDEDFNIIQLCIPVTKECFIAAIQEIQVIKRETASGFWKRHKETFREFYPLFLSTFQVVAGLGLQWFSMNQQYKLAQTNHNDQLALMSTFQASQMKFYESTHDQQVDFQDRVQKEQAVFQNKVHIEQMAQQKVLQEKANEQQLAFQKRVHKDQLELSRELSHQQLMMQLHMSTWGLILQGTLGLCGLILPK